MSVEDLVTGAEAARRLGLSRERVRQLASRPEFPEPVGRIGNAIVWRWAEVEKWSRTRKTTQERRRKH